MIAAEGEFQASKKLSAAAKIITRHPVALQLRFLQTVVEVAAENNSTTLFPIPVDLFAPFLEKATGVAGGGFPQSLSQEDARAIAAAAVQALESGSGEEGGGALDSGEAQRLLAGAKRALGMAEAEPAHESADSEEAGAAADPGDD